MRICVLGGGIAGTLLAWRLAQFSGPDVDLFTGDYRGQDATSASGGGVRCYETDPQQRALALASMLELMSSNVLRDWADYRRTGSAYLRWPDAGLDDAVSEVDASLFGSAEIVASGELNQRGWAGLPEGAVAVVERFAGYISPSRLRHRVLTELSTHSRVRVIGGNAPAIGSGGYDVVVIAAGHWTPEVLRHNGLDDGSYRTKAIQYTIYRTGAWRPPVFVDEISGLYGRPTTDGLLIGLPTQDWDPEQAHWVPDEGLEALVVARFPQLRLGAVKTRVRGIDCYTEQPGLELRLVSGNVHTFTGGSGGSVKTALAASQIAARALTRG